MSSVQARALSLFDDLVELSDVERQHALAKIKEESPALHKELCALLHADAEQLPLLSDSPLELLAATLAEPIESADSLGIGTIFGAWQAMGILGRGGMGVVYAVERSDGKHRQSAALKHIRAEISTPRLVASFLSERDYLASLNHPGVVPLLDSGIDDRGQPWLVMRQVNGTPIDVWCDQKRLSLRQRIELFMEACDAVAYAHECGVLHQDIKPSNLLVTPDGRTQLLDFGLAAMVHDEPVTYRRLAATAHYTAPEVLQGAYPSVHADVYALGMLLYRLLCGALPQSSDGQNHLSVRVPTASHAPPSQVGRQASSDVATQRGCSTPRVLSRRLAGDLDAIALACVELAPNKRYRTVSQLQEELRRWLEYRPVTIRKPTRRYRATRFLRRHRATAITVACVGTLIVLMLGFLSYQQYQAQQEMAANSQVDRFFEQMLEFATLSNLGDKPMPTSVLLKKTEEQLRTQSAGEPAILARGLAVLARNWTLAGNYQKAESLAQEATAQAAGDPLQRAFDQAILAQVQNQEAHFPQAERSARQGLAAIGFAWTQQHSLARVRLETQLADAQSGQGKSKDARQTMNAAIGEAEELNPAIGSVAIADLLVKRGTWWRNRVRMKESEDDLTRAIALAEKRDPVVADDARQSLIRTVRGSRQPDREVKALALGEHLLKSRQQSLGALHPQTGVAWAELAYVQMLNRNNADARTSIDKAESILRLSLDDNHPALARVYIVRANLDTLEGKQDIGMDWTRRALDIYRERYGPTHESTLEARFLLAQEYWSQWSVYGVQSAQATALKMLGDTIADSVAAHGEVAAIHRIAYATLLSASGLKQQADQQLAQARIDATRQYGPRSQELLHVRLAEATSLIDSKADPARTESALDSLVADSHKEKGLYAQSIEYSALLERARWLQMQGRIADARSSLEEAGEVTAKANEPQWQNNVANKIKELDKLTSKDDTQKSGNNLR